MKLGALRDVSALLRALTNTEVAFFESISTERSLSAGEILFEEEGSADAFYIVVDGRIGLELTSAGKEPIVIQTLGRGDLVGISWLFPPHRWNWRARALVDSELAAFDATAIRSEMERNRDLALEVLGVVSREIVDRLHRTRVQLLDLYRGPG
jgi:CRP-like cAMP-binding protein